MTENDGGPAFPVMLGGGAYASQEPGMSLRDWFAGMAPVTDQMAAYAMGCDDGIDLTDDVERSAMCAVWAAMRYEFADAMLAARAKGGGK